MLLLLIALTQFQTGLWVRALSMANPDSIPRIIKIAEDLGVTDIYAQVVVGGYSYYSSELLPRSEYLAKNSNSGYDPLASLLGAAALKNINVHAWVNTMLIWSLDSAPDSMAHVNYTHPDWFIKDIFGRQTVQYAPSEWKNLGLEGTFLDPANPDVRKYIADVCAEIAMKYPIKGVHLDFIRFPGIYWGMPDEESTALFAGMDAEDIRWLTFVRYPRLDLFKRWLIYNYFLLGRQGRPAIELVLQSVSDKLKFMKKDCGISAAVAANPSLAIYQYRQDWSTWGPGLADYVVAMSYTRDILLFKDFVDYTYRYQPDAVMGIGFLWPDMEREAWWERQYVENSGGKGICYFDFASLDTMADLQMLCGSAAVSEESLYQDTMRFAAVNSLFKDKFPQEWVSTGQRQGHETNKLDFALFLLSLSLNPERDLARMDMTRADFLSQVNSDAGAFDYLNSRVFPLGSELIEPPSREIAYDFFVWEDSSGDSSAMVQAAERLNEYSLKATIYPASMNVLARPVFDTKLGERKVLLTRAGLYAYQVQKINEGGKKVKKSEIRPELERIYMFWTIRERFVKLMEQK